MKILKAIFFVSSIILIFCCCNKESDNSESDNKNEPIELRFNFSETEFNNVLIGEWQSVFENAGKENVIYLKFDNQGKAEITIDKDGVEQEYSGDFMVDFMQEPAEENTTQAIIIISSSTKDIVLSRAYFGFHNAFLIDSGLFLRITEPNGVLDKIE